MQQALTPTSTRRAKLRRGQRVALGILLFGVLALAATTILSIFGLSRAGDDLRDHMRSLSRLDRVTESLQALAAFHQHMSDEPLAAEHATAWETQLAKQRELIASAEPDVAASTSMREKLAAIRARVDRLDEIVRSASAPDASHAERHAHLAEFSSVSSAAIDELRKLTVEQRSGRRGYGWDLGRSLWGIVLSAFLLILVGLSSVLLLYLQQRENSRRHAAEEALAAARAELELRVATRTQELSHANERLRGALEQRERVQAELKRSNTELQQFAYIASHDLQEPVRMVTGYLQLLEKRAHARLTSEDREFMAFALGGAARMRELIQGLLTYSRVGRGEAEAEAVDVGEAVQEVLDTLRLSIEESGAEIECGPLPAVKAHPSQVKQLLQNLIANALKFRGADAPRIRISAERAGERWQFSVRDNGIGLAPEFGQRIFEIFQRLHAQSAYSGTGLGLAICKKIVVQYGGEIWVESELGRGATFHFTLPACDVESALPRELPQGLVASQDPIASATAAFPAGE